MIIVRKAEDRRHERHRQREAWMTFDLDNRADSIVPGLRTLELFKEGRLPPRAGTRRPLQGAEIITYVRQGSLVYEDSAGRLGLLHTGEFQRMTAGPRIRYGETNASTANWAHVFQIRLRCPVAALQSGLEQKHFSTAERRGALRVVVSPDARDGSLRINQDVLVYSAILDRGKHLVHELPTGRSAWLHVVQGGLDIADIVLRTGDGAGFTSERTVSLTASEETEVLLLDLGDRDATVGGEEAA